MVDLGPDHTADKGQLYEEGRKWHQRALRAEAINAELLAELKRALVICCETPMVPYEVCNRMRAAIARAEGEGR